MSIAERNKTWDGSPREFWQLDSRTSSPRYWQVWLEGNVVKYRWGQVGGALQEASEICEGVNLGKANEVPPPQHAMEQALRYIKKKDREGYREHFNGQPLDPVNDRAIDFDNLPPSLCFYKPDNSMGPGITKKAEAGQVWYARKRNGLMYVIAKGSQPAKMYSRRMLRQHDDEVGTPYTWDDRFSHIVQSADAIMPSNSILLGELVMDRGGQDDFAAVQSYTKSLTAQSIRDQQMYGLPSFYVWDVAFWEGEAWVSTVPLQERYELISDAVYLHSHLMSVDTLNFPNPAAAAAYAKEKGWEGFVVVDPTSVYGDKGFNFRGKPDRPAAACAKLKPVLEDDFVVYWDPSRGYGEVSAKGRYSGGIKSVALYQYNSRGELTYIANCASGMTEDMKRDLARPELWPAVWRVLYTGRRYVSQGDDTNALDFPRFDAVRADKSPHECVDPNL